MGRVCSDLMQDADQQDHVMQWIGNPMPEGSMLKNLRGYRQPEDPELETYLEQPKRYRT